MSRLGPAALPQSRVDGGRYGGISGDHVSPISPIVSIPPAARGPAALSSAPSGTLAMPNPTEFFCWWITDERTGERRLTRFKLTRADAQRAFPGAEPDPATREMRELPDRGALPATSRPGGTWA